MPSPSIMQYIMQQITRKKLISFSVITFGIVIFSGQQHYSHYLDLNIKYYAESAQVRAPAPRNTASNVVSRAVTPKPTPPTRATTTTTKSSHCIQRAPVDLHDPHHAIEKHPVSRLHEIQAKLHHQEPIFKVIEHRGQQNRNNLEYHVQVTINDNKSASAWAHTKKEAKRRAAIAMLHTMGLPVEGDETNGIC